MARPTHLSPYRRQQPCAYHSPPAPGSTSPSTRKRGLGVPGLALLGYQKAENKPSALQQNSLQRFLTCLCEYSFCSVWGNDPSCMLTHHTLHRSKRSRTCHRIAVVSRSQSEVSRHSAVHPPHALVAEGVLQAQGSDGRHCAHPEAVSIPLPRLASGAPRVSQHTHAALEVRANVEENAPVKDIGNKGHRELGRSYDELAPSAHPALGITANRVGAADGKRFVRGQVPDDVAALGCHGEARAGDVHAALRADVEAVEG
mmetsp:Transcript_21489/g.53151  ORF Transcript_21489/g.53151 Transcript_21489/m.53151 type:complete len:258 (+) Transcript_21489:297-1070(+)